MSDQYDSLRGVGLTVGTPMFGGQCYSEYAMSLAGLSGLCGNYHIRFKLRVLTNHSFIPLARNLIANDFLKSDTEHLLFWDADVGIDPKNILTLMQIQKSNPKIDIIGAVYPLKKIDWHNAQKAVLAGTHVDELDSFACRFPGGGYDFDRQGSEMIVKVDKLATGMMMISKSALERWAKFYPDETYGFDGTITDGLYKKGLVKEEIIDLMKTDKRTAFFQGGIDKETGQFLPEDFLFCKTATEAGLNIFVCPWMELTHTGINIFRGSVLNNYQNNLPI